MDMCCKVQDQVKLVDGLRGFETFLLGEFRPKKNWSQSFAHMQLKQIYVYTQIYTVDR